MPGRQRILPVRREYNRWVANQTLEDYALRFTARSARRWAPGRVAQTAIGAISFLALEAIGGAVTLSYGVANAVAAIGVVAVILLLTGLPISRYAARYGVDIDLLTRGAGFGYIGSTITSLVYASFTFILFAIEASIMSAALEVCFGIPLPIGYVISAVAVIPLVTHGVTWISRFQLLTQPLWIVLNVLPVGFILARNPGALSDWTGFAGAHGGADTVSVLGFGGAASVILALMPQIGEQVDILRFLPERSPKSRWSWYAALFAAGPGWVLLGVPKMLFGSFLAVLALRAGVSADHAAEPGQMYRIAFGYVLPWPEGVLALTAAFVAVSQLKINVMNAYAGSLAWSNFFSRLTHSHPGRVVWLVFNVAIALLLMELGIYRALEETLGLFAVVAVAWLGSIVADLAINKPLGLSPPGIEFKRAHLYDINPVGVGSMTLATAVALLAAGGVFGDVARALSPFVALAVALVAAPLIAWGTRGRFYLARRPRAHWRLRPALTCSICENAFEPDDMAYCPAYAAPICSLCCSLDARCHDLCKPQARMQAQVEGALTAVLPTSLRALISPRLVRYAGVLIVFVGVIGLVLYLIGVQAAVSGSGGSSVRASLWAAFFILLIVAGVAAWFLVLAQESRQVAQEETARQTTALLREIEAHRRTDVELQRAKEVAEAANLAKSRYVVGLSHELRTPLNAVLGYAQLLERDEAIPEPRQRGVKVIRRSAEHLSGLIDGLLDISKIESGRLQLQHGPVRLDEFLDGLVGMFRLQAEAKGLGFTFDRAANLPRTVRTDEKRLRQVLINLLSNAIKFTAAGEVSLQVSYRNQVATLGVGDTGPGIPAGDLGRIFEPFDRGSVPERHTAPGLGLGLTITRLLVEIMGGEIRATSDPGQGSRFEIRLMLSALEAEPDPPARTIRGYAGPRRTILVVDDDADHQSLMREALEPLGFSILAARDGATALSMIADASPDLVLLDVQMPGMTGWELALILRERGFAAPIIMLSANVQQGLIQEGVIQEGGIQEKGIHEGAGEHGLVQGNLSPRGAASAGPHDDLLPKPFELGRLLDRVGRHLRLDWLGEAPPPPATRSTTATTPCAADLEELLGLARIGYVRGIEAKLAGLADDHPSFVTALRARLQDFDFPGLVQALEGSLAAVPESLDG